VSAPPLVITLIETRQIEISDQKVDRLVYEMFGLGDEDRRFVEGLNAG
jgi:hypothetical protein